MTTQEKLTKIESVIREVCPELIGCGDKNCKEGHYSIGYNEETDEVDWGGCSVCVKDGEYTPQVREIHLENILRAIESKDPGEWLVRPDGDIYRDMNPYASKAHIDLTLPLHLQSDEFISWLYGVLVIE